MNPQTEAAYEKRAAAYNRLMRLIGKLPYKYVEKYGLPDAVTRLDVAARGFGAAYQADNTIPECYRRRQEPGSNANKHAKEILKVGAAT